MSVNLLLGAFRSVHMVEGERMVRHQVGILQHVHLPVLIANFTSEVLANDTGPGIRRHINHWHERQMGPHFVLNSRSHPDHHFEVLVRAGAHFALAVLQGGREGLFGRRASLFAFW